MAVTSQQGAPASTSLALAASPVRSRAGVHTKLPGAEESAISLFLHGSTSTAEATRRAAQRRGASVRAIGKAQEKKRSGIVIATHLSQRLARSKTAEILLIDRNRVHVWKPMLHTFAAGTAEDTDEISV